ncbi:hypothetical protein [Corynebacterium aquatimens]|uniref:hypothetical protein n=1 Tax=Corynebacterium aquatimens TaxID=1190508 RepID=UPI0033142156
MIAFLRFALAAIGGWLVYFSYEPIGLSLAAPLGIGLFYLALMPWSRRFTAATGMAGRRRSARLRGSARCWDTRTLW